MKKIVVIILCIVLYGCDPTYCYDYVIENRTNRNVEIIGFSTYNNEVKSIKIEILANNNYLEYNDCGLGQGGIIYNREDSIQIKSNEILLKTYYPNDEGESIYKTRTILQEGVLSSWKIVEEKGNYTKYVFEITQENLK